ncbi:SpoIIE family protein phosphatase [Actinorugispora endophytica]|uniref:PAS domain S-box-containing protein n=1 Tax=Actinorugispora endophytica TaxID=1605990 RepID=A0A4R6UB62_9ACTN|nr:SpoIIE family protein phosphatase [Actinorugispora endophytica]TDQ43900.1 PAS domain S-box-containing protein [Actinorugispora endophytica]
MDRNTAAPWGGADGPVPVTHTAVAVVGRDGAVLAWSEGAEWLLGYTPAEVVGFPVADLYAPGETGVVPPDWYLTSRSGWEDEISVLHRDGHPLRIRVQAQPMADAHGGTLWFLGAGLLEPDPQPPAGVGAVGSGDLRSWALEQLPFPVAVYDHRMRLADANDSMLRIMGRPLDLAVGLRLTEISPNPSFVEFDRLTEQALRNGKAIHHEAHGRFSGDRRENAWSMSFVPLKDRSGLTHGVATVLLDTTDQYWARRRLAVLNEASTRIGSTLDMRLTAQETTDVAVPQFADFAAVDLLESVHSGEEPTAGPITGPVTLRRIAHRAAVADLPESADRLGKLQRYPAYSPPARCLAQGRSVGYRADDPDFVRWISESPDRVKVVRDYRVHSVLVVPLLAREAILGVVLFLRHGDSDPFNDDDLKLAEEIAAKAAVSVDNARRYTRERATALALQRSLLPQRLPRHAAVDVATRYLPASSRFGIGGDWYDVIPLSGSRVALVVGDVVGHGLHASATMGRLRTAVRTLADVDLHPEELLAHLDDLVVHLNTEEETPFGTQGDIGASCLYAVYDPISRRCVMARAGHPPPAVVTPDGAVDFVDLPAGPPLGVGGLPFETTEFELSPGSLLVLYTDGLVEAAGRDIGLGLSGLRRALAEPAPSLDAACDTILRTLLPNGAVDDAALLVARTRALDAHKVATWDLPSDPAIVGQVRAWTSEQLAAWGLEDMVFTTELVVSELVTNAIRYASAPIQLRLIQDSALICEVSDASNTAPHLRRARTLDEGGRGLFLVAQLSQRWGTRHKMTGKTIWAEQALPG